MITINFRNQNEKRPVDFHGMKRAAKKVLEILGKKNTELDIVFLSNQKIRVLNRVYLGKDTATDVLAFSDESKKNRRVLASISKQSVSGRKGKDKRAGKKFLGNIAISSDKAFSNAAIFKTCFKEEIMLYVIHGILHLSGYDDTAPKTRVVMRKKENEFLQKTRQYL